MARNNKLISILLLSTLILNLLVTKNILTAQVKGDFADALKCNSVLFYCTVSTLLTLTMVNAHFAREAGIPVLQAMPLRNFLHKTTIPQKHRVQARRMTALCPTMRSIPNA